ncbi:MAG: START-like domain-containing protein [Emticicia sp.]
MEKFKFSREYEFRASPKVLYQYFSTPAGLQQWFASKVKYTSDSNFDFIWDNESHPARMSVQRVNKLVKFDFLKDEQKGNFVEFKLEQSELTNATFLKVTDNSEISDVSELEDIWDDMIYKLKEIVGG